MKLHLHLAAAVALLSAGPVLAQELNPASPAATERRFSTEVAGLGAVYQQLHQPVGIWNYAAPASGLVNTTTAVTLKAAAATGKRNYIASCTMGHDTLGAATELVIRDGASGTILVRRKLQTTAIETGTIEFRTPLQSSTGTLLEYATLTAVTGGVYLNCQGYTD